MGPAQGQLRQLAVRHELLLHDMPCAGVLQSDSVKPMFGLCRPTALLRVVFWDGEQLEWNPLLTTVNHIIIGKLSISHTGTLHVRGSKGGLASKTVFKEPTLAARRMVRPLSQQHYAGACPPCAHAWPPPLNRPRRWH